ncbi:MAG: hypothetical protein HZB16_23675 [Armatimonadetes bacterium]|nr:hypothetical protein [Armatimonadota bacterium]
MKRWTQMLAAVAVCGLYLAPSVRAEDKAPIKLTVSNEHGHQFDLIEAAGGDALLVFINAAKFKAEDAPALEEALNKIAAEAGDTGDEDESNEKAAVGGPRVTRLEEGAKKDGIEVAIVVLSDDKDVWDHIKATWKDAKCHIVLADPTKEDAELKAFDLPEDLTWAAYLVVGSEVANKYTSEDDLDKGSKEISDDLNKDDEV